jgi:hypothetical protein
VNDETATKPMCSKCDAAEAGPGGILCPGCMAIIAAQRL